MNKSLLNKHLKIIRKINIDTKIGILIIFVLINIVSLFYPQLIFEKARARGDRLIMAEEFLRNNDYENAKKQLEKFSEKNNSRYIDLWQKAIEPEKVQEEIIKYEKLVETYPNYRDAWLKLAELYERTLQKQKATAASAVAANLDPNYFQLNP